MFSTSATSARQCSLANVAGTVTIVIGSRTRQGRGKHNVASGFLTPSSGNPEGTRPSKRCKEHDSNWICEEILVEAKREEYLEEMEVVDVRDLKATDISKWGHIVEKVNSITRNEIVCEGPAYKHKWQSTLSEYKCIANFHA